MKRVIIDTDPGIDDAAAIFLALASPELKVEAITTIFGNGTLQECTRNALIILETAGRSDIPVYAGAGKPLLRELTVAHNIHGEDALGGVGLPDPKSKPQTEHAVYEMIDRVMASPGEITLIALGRLTNVALALSIEPRMAGALKELILMGGAVLAPGNASEVATANLHGDPEAAAIVYQSGAPIVQVGMDVCRHVVFRQAHLARLRQARNPATGLLMRITPQLAGAYAERLKHIPGAVTQYNDVPAVAYALDPSLFDARDLHVRIATHDELTKGQTVTDVDNRWQRPPNARVLMAVDANRLIEMFLARLAGCTAS